MTSNQLDPCTRYNKVADVHYREFSCVYPQLEPLYFEFEKGYDPYDPVGNWMLDHPRFPVYVTAVYVVLIFGGQALMKTRPAWNWRKTLMAWNFSLSIFSFIGLSRTLPQLLHNLATMSLRDNVCHPDAREIYSLGSTGLWVQLFVLSKFPELLDTFFIVIHKKRLIFLHWYHHITVLLACWYLYVTRSQAGIFLVVMNYGVHAVMYGYYFLMAAKLRPRWMNPMIITLAQIVQMVVGVYINLFGFYHYVTDSTCQLRHEQITIAGVLYGSYLILFLQFFLGRYVNPKERDGDKGKAKKML